jgi:hypothetical protein
MGGAYRREAKTSSGSPQNQTLSLHWILYRDRVDPEAIMAAFLPCVFQGIVVPSVSQAKRPRR